MAMARSALLLSRASASGVLSVCRRQVAASDQALSLPLFSLLSCDCQAPGFHLFLRRYCGAPPTREELKKLLEAERARAERAEKLVKELLEKQSAMHGMHVQRELRLASSCFGQPYKGTGSVMLKQILDKRVKEFEDSLSTLPNKSNESLQRFYAKYVALTNSSAMGKSRTVLQLGHDHNVFVFYCSCALPTATTFPPRTPWLASRLETALTTHEMTLYMVSWLQVLVTFLGKQSHIQNAAKCWVELQERSFYNPEEAGVVEQVFDVWQKLCGEHTVCSSEEKELQKRLETKITEVLEVLKHESSELKLLFVVDEAEALLVEKERTTYPPFFYLRRAAQVLGNSTLLLVMGTNASITGEDDESRRARGLLHPVCNSSGLDLMVQDGEVAPAAVRTWLENPLRWTLYGRPLWGLRYSSEGDIKKLLELAQLKLLNVSKFDDTGLGLRVDPRRLPPETTVSLLAFTVGIEIVPCHPLAREVSSGHMTAMAIISEDRKSFWTVAPLEPVLSAAAASLLQDPDVLERALVHQLDFVRRGYTTMPRDDRLETVLKTIVMVAMLECQEPLIRRGEFLSCVPTADFLRILLGPNCHLPPSLNHSYVFFNRIVRVDHIPSPLEVMEYYKRGVICAGAAENNNLGVDLYIFVWFPHAKKQNRGKCELKNGEGEQSEGFSADHFSQILVTTKLEEGQAARKLTSTFVGVLVPEGLPIIIDYQVGSVPSLGKVKAPCEADQHVYSLTGIPMALSAGRFKACMEQLTKLVELDAVLCADQEPQQCFSNVDPWTRLQLMPKKFKDTVRKKKEKRESQTARTRLSGQEII